MVDGILAILGPAAVGRLAEGGHLEPDPPFVGDDHVQQSRLTDDGTDYRQGQWLFN